MITERTNVCKQDCDIMNLALNDGLDHNIHMTGEIIDRIYRDGEFVEERVGHNLVVNTFLSLVMCLLKKKAGYSGIQYWAVGSGSPSWDEDIPSPDISATRLTNEIARVPISTDEMQFLDSDYNVVSTPTNILQIKHLFTTDECNGVWREFGIFGGNATSAVNSGILINKRHHAILTKTSDMTVERTMRFTLNLV